MAQCTQIKGNGERCEGKAIRGSHPQRCYFHSDRKRRRVPVKTVALERIDTSSIGGVAEFLSKLMIAVCRGEVDVKQSNTLVYCASNLARIIEASELEKRVTELEKQTDESIGKAG